jgi:hypothetical protein
MLLYPPCSSGVSSETEASPPHGRNTMAAPSPWPSRAVGDPVVRRHHTSEAEVGAPLIPLLGRTGQWPAREGATASRFMPSHGPAAVVRRCFRRVLTFTPEDWDSGSLAFALSAGSNATCRTASCDSRAFLPACSCPVGLSAAGKLVAQAPPSSASRLHRGCDDAPHGAHRTCDLHHIRLPGAIWWLALGSLPFGPQVRLQLPASNFSFGWRSLCLRLDGSPRTTSAPFQAG